MIKRKMTVSVIISILIALACVQGFAQEKKAETAAASDINLAGSVWESDTGHGIIRLSFEADGKGRQKSPGGSVEFTYTADTLTMTLSGKTSEYEYSINENKLIIKKYLYESVDVTFEKKERQTNNGGTQSSVVEGRKFTFTPAIGFSVLGASLNNALGSINVSATQFNLGLQAAMIGLRMAQRADLKNNFTSILNMDMGIRGSSKIEGTDGSLNGTVESGVLFQMSLLAGYKFEPKTNMYITPAAGMGFASAALSSKIENVPVNLTVGSFSVPLYADFKFFFTEKAGIDINIINTLNFGNITGVMSVEGGLIDSISFSNSFHNTFVLKAGPVFRF